MGKKMRDPSAPPKRRQLLRALAGTPVLARRGMNLASVPAAARTTLGGVVRRDPAYAPATPLLARLGTGKAGSCAPLRRAALVAARVDHPPHGGVDPLVGTRPLRPARSAANLLHQLLTGLWSLGDIPVAQTPDAGPTEACDSGQRPPRSGVALESQVPPPEEVAEVAEPPQAEARTPQTCDRPCGPVAPGARQLAARAGRIPRPGPQCGEIRFESQYTPFAPEQPDSRGKPGEHESPCPCECVCTRKTCGVSVEYVDWYEPPVIDFIDAAFTWLACSFGGFLADAAFPDLSVGCVAVDQAGRIASMPGGASLVRDALRGGQSQGLGMFAGAELELGLMRPALSLSALATAGIPGPVALAAPDIPGWDVSLILARAAIQHRAGALDTPKETKP